MASTNPTSRPRIPGEMLSEEEIESLRLDFKKSAAFVRRYWRLFPLHVDDKPPCSKAFKRRTR